MRDAFSKCLVSLAKSDAKVLLLTGDHGYSLFDEFRKECPEQYINAGIAEQNMVGMAAGLARVGYRPFVYGLSAFIPLRVIEQIKIDIAHDKLPVVLIGDGAGFVYSHLGASHQATEDIACCRAIPNLSIFSPADRFELESCMIMSYESKGPVYLRLGKADRGDVHSKNLELKIGNLVPIKTNKSNDISFITTGSLVKSVMNIALENFPNSSVWSSPFIKPFENKQIVDICKRSQVLIVIEEHSIYGGLGSVVSEIISEFSPIRLLRIGVQDRFSQYCGTYDYLLEEHGLDELSLIKKIKQFIESI
ncbi:MAG: transketolase [Planctomycetota bacterium]|nr:MAG: transketolase [Planctomycetota bacterium]